MIVHKSQTRSVASASAVTGLGALMPRLNMFGTVWRRGGWTVHGSKLCLLFRYSPWGSDDSLGSRPTVNWDLSPPPPTPLSAALTPGLSTPSSMPVNDLLHLLVPARTTLSRPGGFQIYLYRPNSLSLICKSPVPACPGHSSFRTCNCLPNPSSGASFLCTKSFSVSNVGFLFAAARD